MCAMRRRGGRGNAIEANPITADGATLPVIRAAGFEVHVNAYAVGQIRRPGRPAASPRGTPYGPAAQSQEETASRGSPGCVGGVTDLWYLSLVGARGHGTTMRALWANLVSNRAHGVWLEGVGSVALGHHRLDLARLGYPIHWTYRQAVVPPGRDVQGVLEADALTCYDPLLAPDTAGRRGRASTAGRAARTEGARPQDGSATTAATLTLASSSSGGGEGPEEVAAREARPLFLLLVRGDQLHAYRAAPEGPDESGDIGDTSSLAKSHLRFLSTRIAWLPYYPRWAAYLWERALDRGEAEPLRTWCYAPEDPSEVAGRGAGMEKDVGGIGGTDAPSRSTAQQVHSALVGAYLCRPQPLALTSDLQRAIRAGVFAPRAPGGPAEAAADQPAA